MAYHGGSPTGAQAKSRFVLITALLGLGLAGCAGLTEETCLTGDWNTVGYIDGVNGLDSEKVQDRLKECGRYDIALDPREYEIGRTRGLTVFCSPRGALDAGLRNVGNINLCVGAPSLTQRSYRIGRQYSEAKREFESEENQYESAVSSISRLRRELRDLREYRDDAKEKPVREDYERRIREKRDKIEYERDRADRALFDVRRAERRFREVERDYDRFLYELEDYERRQALEAPRPEAPSVGPERDPGAGPVQGSPAISGTDGY